MYYTILSQPVCIFIYIYIYKDLYVDLCDILISIFI